MSELIAMKFIEPHFVKQVGKIGLTSKDLAYALEIPIKRIHQKIKRDNWTQKEKWKPVTIVTEENESIFFLETRAAKAFIAKYATIIGDDYLDFLFDCEDIAINKVPKLLSIIEQLKAKIEKPKISRSKGLIVTAKTIVTQGLFEPIVQIIKEKVLLDSLTQMEREQWVFEHRNLVAEGLLKKNNEQLKLAKIIPISTVTRKQLEEK